jgi:hypothetical protein
MYAAATSRCSATQKVDFLRDRQILLLCLPAHRPPAAGLGLKGRAPKNDLLAEHHFLLTPDAFYRFIEVKIIIPKLEPKPSSRRLQRVHSGAC